MKAVVFEEFGDTSVLKQAEVRKPVPARGELLVRVSAVALNPVDYKIRQGHLNEVFPTSFPRILGGDISGVVTEVGPGADDFKVGDSVYFLNPLDRDGGYAEFVVVNQEQVAIKPSSLSFEEAASLPVVGLTSVQALRDFGQLKKGDKVLVHAGAGGVGSFAIQYAKEKGAKVFATSSAAKATYVKSLGADRVIDYSKEDFVDVALSEGGMDIVLETLGGENYIRSIMATKKGGAVPSIVNPPDEETIALARENQIKTDFMLLEPSRADLDEISALVDAGKIVPTVSRTIDFDQIQLGHELLESGRTQGKIVMKVL